jgi:hypothetical protein
MCTAKIGLRRLLLVIMSTATMLCVTMVPAANPEGKSSAEKKGLRIWVNNKGVWCFHTHTAPNHRHVFTGKIGIVGAKITGVSGIANLEKGDSWLIDNDKKNTITFRLTTNGKWDMIDFRLNHRAERLIFDINEDGKPMRTDRIHIGAGDEHPMSSHFTLPGK